MCNKCGNSVSEPVLSNGVRTVAVCTGTGCLASGAMAVVEALRLALKGAGFTVVESLAEARSAAEPQKTIYLGKSGCQGFCAMGPLVTIRPAGILYTRVKAEDAERIVNETLIKGETINDLLYTDPVNGNRCTGTADIPFYAGQKRQVLARCGELDPDSVDDYRAFDGYKAAAKVYGQMTPEAVCRMMLDSGLRGRGGGGFPTGRKWDLARVQKNDKKFVICNGDEGDPGAFMDRSVMEGNPHAVVEGMMIAAFAIGADEGYVYVRAEYPLAVRRMRQAIKDAEAAGILGKNVLGTGRSLKLTVVEGAGAFVCGEETALIASIEGKRGMPAPKPPFPAVKGLFGKPTIINNVETLATVPLIVLGGVDEYRKNGTKDSPGTKTFALSGHVANTGLIEVPLGTTLRQVIFDIGGGVTDEKGRIWKDGFKAVQIGGPSGGCLTEQHYDLPLDFDSLRSIGAMVGSGGLVVMNKNTCMVSIARYFMQFTQNESCGKCVPCREGTRQMLALLDDIIEGRATAQTLELLVELSEVVREASLCGLGKTAPNPIISTLRYFRSEYEAHVVDKYCATGKCKALARPHITDACKGCTACSRVCPVGAISGAPGKLHVIDGTKCIKCGACKPVCRFKAITGV
jgi:NADH-quinone oxidoreductase subunit F